MTKASLQTTPSMPERAVAEADDTRLRKGGQWSEHRVRPGDSLSAIFSQLEIHSHLRPILAQKEAAESLRALYPGQLIRVRKEAGQFRELVYEPDDRHVLRVVREGDSYRVQKDVKPVEIRRRLASGIIRDSLFVDGRRAGLSDSVIMELAGIFGWDIDFALDLRKGDSFTIIYEELYRNGEKIGDGKIIAAEFTNQGRDYQAIRYTRPDGITDYYSPDGRSMRKAFLRTPVNFTRISSRFTLHRKHPILNRIRAHKGVDYAAPRGTPVKAAGDGKVIFKGRKGGYGRVIIIKHGARYSTLYAHLNGYRRGLRVGSRVKQGQVIGYVGMSGLATGPHLHYEFRVNGVHRNPLTVKLPAAQPLPARYMADFKAHAQPLLSQIKLYRRTTIAEAARQDQG
ncbi:MAG: peptidase M23 [Gammaproteobacteria bacterium]|nr:MAG: peptidase M23 [Gammaproteobacteria bacterium]